LLGPNGNSFRRLQEETMCKMAILGRGSMKDKQREEELRNSLDPKYAHLNEGSFRIRFFDLLYCKT
jgi:KH domain-containing RNA-binding signal transduction-associated protein 3